MRLLLPLKIGRAKPSFIDLGITDEVTGQIKEKIDIYDMPAVWWLMAVGHIRIDSVFDKL